MREALEFLRRNKLSFIVTALACLFTLMLWPLTERLPVALFLAAVALAAWQEGPRATLLTTALCTAVLLMVSMLLPANGSADVIALLAVLVIVGLLAAYLRREFERAHQASEHVQAALAGSRDAVIFADARGRVTRLNFSAQALVGWHPLNALDQPLGLVLQVKSEQTGKLMDELAGGALQRPETLDLPAGALVVSTQGKETPVEGYIASLVDSGGRITGLMVCFRDVSQRRQAEQTARLREEKLREKLLDALRDGEERMRSVLADFEPRLKEQQESRTKAEAALQQAQAQFDRLLAEKDSAHGAELAALRQGRQDFEEQVQEQSARRLETETALRKAKDELTATVENNRLQEDLEKQLSQALAQKKQAEEESHKLRDELAALAAARTAERAAAEEQLRQVRDELAQQLDEHLTGHRDQQTSLMAELAGSKTDQQELRASNQRLQELAERNREQLAAGEAAALEHRQRAELLESLVDNSGLGMFAFDGACRLTFWNAGMERITGFDRSAVLGRLAFEVFPALEESGESRHFLDALEGKRVLAQSAVLSQDGSRGELEQTYVPLSGESPASGGMVFAREIVVPRRNGDRVEQAAGEFAASVTAGRERALASSLFRADWDWLSFN
ncbi:MAG TPA: PAS domain S-box protein [Gemmataceae bacterium]|nr:PAS domain S-box protein [Gemmataceae bacterium]